MADVVTCVYLRFKWRRLLARYPRFFLTKKQIQAVCFKKNHPVLRTWPWGNCNFARGLVHHKSSRVLVLQPRLYGSVCRCVNENAHPSLYWRQCPRERSRLRAVGKPRTRACSHAVGALTLERESSYLARAQARANLGEYLNMKGHVLMPMNGPNE